jgi:MFS family permease
VQVASARPLGRLRRVTPPAASVVRNPDFVRLWTAQTISQFGTQVSLLALPLVAISLLQASAFDVALLGTVEFLPFILFSLAAGAWVDRLRRRPILILGDVGRALALGSIPIAFGFGALTLTQLFIVAFVVGILTVFFDVAYQSYLPAVVERDQLVDGNGKLEVSRTIAQTAGPTIGGGLIGLVTAPLAILVDSLSYVFSALFVLLIRTAEPTPDPRVDEHGRVRGGLRDEVAQGLRYVLGNPYLRGIAACTGITNFFSSMVFATYLVYAVRELGMTAVQIGLVFGLGNVGSILGALIADRLRRRLGLGPTLVWAIFLGTPGLLLIALAPRAFPFPFLVASGLLFGLSVVVYNINQLSFRQAITPATMQGRMHATMRFIVWGTMPIGSILGGVIATASNDVGLAIRIGAIGSLFGVIPLVITPVRTLRDMPAPLDEVPPTGADVPGAATS